LSNESWYFIAIAIAIIVLLVWCRAADQDSGDSESLVVVTRRLTWKHFKLACWMTIGLGIIMWLFSSMSKKRPSAPEKLVQLIVGPLAAVALGLCVFSSFVYDGHRAAFNIGVLALYLVWLGITTSNVVWDDEYRTKRGTKVLRMPDRDDVWGSEEYPYIQYQNVPKDVQQGLVYADGYPVRRALYKRFYEDLRDGLYDTGNPPSREWELHLRYTKKEFNVLTLKAMVPWVVVAASIMVFIPWHGSESELTDNRSTTTLAATPTAESAAPIRTNDEASPQSQPTSPLTVEPSLLSQLSQSAKLDIRSLLTTWTESFKEKDLTRQMNCYAPVMDTYFLKHDVSRDFVQEDKLRAFNSIAEIQLFEISDVTIEFASSTEATVKFRKKWNTRSVSGKAFAGDEIEQLELVTLGGRWKIASEKELQVLRVDGHSSH
jgi:hypothetical protein